MSLLLLLNRNTQMTLTAEFGVEPFVTFGKVVSDTWFTMEATILDVDVLTAIYSPTTFAVEVTMATPIVVTSWDAAAFRINGGADVTYSQNLQCELNVYSIVEEAYLYPDAYRWKEGLDGVWSEWADYPESHFAQQRSVLFPVTAVGDGNVTIYAEVRGQVLSPYATPLEEEYEVTAQDSIYLTTATMILSDDIFIETNDPEEPPDTAYRPRRLPIASVRRADIKAKRRRVG